MDRFPMRAGRRCAPRPLAVEFVESRRLLAGDTPTVVPLTLIEDAGPPPAVVATAIGQGLEAFASAEAYADWLVARAVERWDHLLGQPAFGGWWSAAGRASGLPGTIFLFDGGSFTAANAAHLAGDPPAAITGPLEAAASSTTNTQIAGVDEADLVETDGDILYALSQRRLAILAGFTAGQPRLIGRFEFDDPGRVAGMYLAGNRLTVLSQQADQTQVTVLDVADPAAPVVAGRTLFDGQLVASRMVGGQLRLVLNHRLEIPSPEIIPLDSDPPAPGGDPVATPSGSGPRPATAALTIMPWPRRPAFPAGIYETAEAYAARIRQRLVATMTPQVYQVDAAGNPFDLATLVEPTAIDVPVAGRVDRLTTITAIDLADDAGRAAATVGLFTGGEVEVFATAEDMFLFDAGDGFPSGGVIRPLIWEPPLTTVTQIGFATASDGGTTVALAAQGSFTGRVLNQFAADEREGLLRVVVENPGAGSGVVILAAEGERLAELGSLTGLAPGEDLYSVRFVADRAYFVTFVRTDPLFVVDLSTPTAPTLLGELHVPGFSDHIQPLDGGHLLTIGRDADERTGMFRGLQVSIFDVRDPASPALLHRATLEGGRDASTPISGDRWRRGDGDHLALGFFPDQGVITIPVETAGWPVSRQQLEVFAVDVAAGISRLGSIDHETPVDRAVQIGGQLVAVSSGTVTLHDFADPSVTLAAVPLDGGMTATLTGLPEARPALPPSIASLIARATKGLPLNRGWTVSLTETVGDRTILYARHASGALHRLTSTAPVAEAGWAAFGFESVGNLGSTPVPAFTIGRPPEALDTPLDPGPGPAVLAWFGLTRDAAGRLITFSQPSRQS